MLAGLQQGRRVCVLRSSGRVLQAGLPAGGRGLRLRRAWLYEHALLHGGRHAADVSAAFATSAALASALSVAHHAA